MIRMVFFILTSNEKHLVSLLTGAKLPMSMIVNGDRGIERSGDDVRALPDDEMRETASSERRALSCPKNRHKI